MKDLPLQLDHATSVRIAEALQDAVKQAMADLWATEGGHLGKIDVSSFRRECGFALRRLGDGQLDLEFPPPPPAYEPPRLLPDPVEEVDEFEIEIARGTPTNGEAKP